MDLTRDAAWTLLNEYTKSESLIKHALAVEAAVRGYARHFKEDEDGWGIVALLHDFDYERWPSLEEHPFRGVEILKGLGYPEWVTRAILSHADYSGVSRDSLLEKTLFACDEMAGFLTAASLVRPSRSILDLEASSVMKRMKDKAFARGVSATICAPAPGCSGCRSTSTSETSSRSCGNRPTRWACGARCDRPPDGRRTASRPSSSTPTAMTEQEPVVALEGVSVRYGMQLAMQDVTAVFPPGAVGLLGPNGAGKSTMIRTLLGFIAPHRGRMRVLGFDVAHAPLDIRARVGYMPESDAHIPGMNAVSFVAYCGELAGLPPVDAMQRAHEVLFYVGLGEARYRAVETYSTGMKQRIKLAQAIVHDPGSAVPGRADQRHGPQGPRRDARARPRPGSPQRGESHPLLAPPA